MSGGIFVIALLLIGLLGDAHGELGFDVESAKEMKKEMKKKGYEDTKSSKISAQDLVQRPNMTDAVPLGVRFRRALATSAIPSEHKELADDNEVFAIKFASNDVQNFQNSNEVFLSIIGEEKGHHSKASRTGISPQVCAFREGFKTAAKWSKIAGKSANTFYLEVRTHSRKSFYLAVLNTPLEHQKNLQDSTVAVGLVEDMSKAIEWRTVSVDENLNFLLVVRDHSASGSGAVGLFLSTYDDDNIDTSDSSGGLKLVLRSYFPVGIEFKST
eukprot:g2510.t1